MLHTVIIVIQVLAAMGVIALVLLQHGKGADAGASFGSGASQTVFGSVGSGNFLTHATAVCALVFFSASLALAHLNKKAVATLGSLDFDKVATPVASATPATDLPVLPSAASNDLPAPVNATSTSEAAANIVSPEAMAPNVETSKVEALNATVVPEIKEAPQTEMPKK